MGTVSNHSDLSTKISASQLWLIARLERLPPFIQTRMQCPFCQHTDSRVLESRSAEAGQSVRRRRECLQCNRRFTTYERIEFVPITVIKRNQDRELFDRSKLLKGVATACEKTGLTAVQLESLVDDVEAELQQQAIKEVTSTDLGESVLARLKSLNEVAYVRFASVYRQFRGIRDFVDALDQLKESEDSQLSSLQSKPQEDPSQPAVILFPQ